MPENYAQKGRKPQKSRQTMPENYAYANKTVETPELLGASGSFWELLRSAGAFQKLTTSKVGVAEQQSMQKD